MLQEHNPDATCIPYVFLFCLAFCLLKFHLRRVNLYTVVPDILLYYLRCIRMEFDYGAWSASGMNDESARALTGRAGCQWVEKAV